MMSWYLKEKQVSVEADGVDVGGLWFCSRTGCGEKCCECL